MRSEILDGEDFYLFEGKVDIIETNGPFSHVSGIGRRPSPLLKKCVELKPRVIALLGGSNHPTQKNVNQMVE